MVLSLHGRAGVYYETIIFNSDLSVCRPKSSYEGFELTFEEDSGTAEYACNEASDVVSLSETDKKHYRTLFSSALVSYDNLNIGDAIGQGMYVYIAWKRLVSPLFWIPVIT